MAESVANEENNAQPTLVIPLREAFLVWLRIGLLSFGGPAGQIALMQRILIDEKRWISETRFLHALNYCMLLPGPEAIQLAIYIGWLLDRTRGGLMAGLLFLLPGVIALMAFSLVYVLAGDLPLVQALLFGLKAAVLAIVVGALIRLAGRALGNRTRYLIAGAGFAGLFVLGLPFPVVILAAGVLGLFGGWRGWQSLDHQPHGNTGDAPVDDRHLTSEAGGTRYVLRTLVIWLPLWLAPIALLVFTLGMENVFTQIALFFSKLAVVTFGGAYAVLSYMTQQAVEHHGWLSAGEMLDGLGLAESTPGPLIMVVQFVGFLGALRESGMDPLLGGVLGGLFASWVTFVPCFLWIFLGAPYVESMRSQPLLTSALAAITAAVVGVILNLAIWFGLHLIFTDVGTLNAGPISMPLPTSASIDFAALALVSIALVALFYLKMGLFSLLGLCALLGMLANQGGLL